jgi:Tfp pilus assembly protein PilX
MLHDRFTAFSKERFLKDQRGFLLVAALTLLSALTLLGTTAYLLSSTDIKIGGNFKNQQMALQVAMAGAEQARQALRLENLSSSDTASFSDELNSAIRKGVNGVLNGYSTTTDDQSIASGTLNGASYSSFLTNDSADGTANTTDANGKVMITSVATGPGTSKAIVQTIVGLYSLPPSPATVYSQDNVTLSGSSISISGTNACDPSSSLAPIYTVDPATTTQNGTPVLSGSPPTPQHGTTSIDLPTYAEALKASANTTLTSDESDATYGSSSNYVTVYSDATAQADGELRLNNVTGYGILVVKGNLQLAGNLNWTGIILVTGVITSSGGGSNSKNIMGQVYAGSSALGDSTISGSVTIGYDSCKVKQALAAQAIKVSSWKQIY